MLAFGFRVAVTILRHSQQTQKINRNYINVEHMIQGHSDSASGRVIAYRFYVSSFVEPSGNSVSLLTREYPTEEVRTRIRGTVEDY